MRTTDGCVTPMYVTRPLRTPMTSELVGLAPSAAFDGFPDEIPVRGRATIEDALLGPV